MENEDVKVLKSLAAPLALATVFVVALGLAGRILSKPRE